MSDDKLMREKVRQAIRAGRVPGRRPERMWAGPGVGARCPICDAPVWRDELEMEVEFAGDSSADSYHLHLRCFLAWEQLELGDGRPARTIPLDAPSPSAATAADELVEAPSTAVADAGLSKAIDTANIARRGFIGGYKTRSA